jgi:hypothetical protein
MTYPPTLTDEQTGQPISATTTKCIILIHGWNPSGANDCYDFDHGFEFYNLISNLKLELKTSGFAIVAYDWHLDADTGAIWDNLFLNFDFVPPTQAAANAALHGVHMATQINGLAPRLREVHFIAHSAGSWTAINAAQLLLQLNPYVVVQITLLDPFIPYPSGIFDPNFSDSAVEQAQFFTGNDRIQRLENYYANDSPEHGWNPAPWGNLTGPTYNTQETFAWRSGIDINQEVDWGTLTGIPPYTPNYDWHAGPIQFYSDTVFASIFPSTPPSGLPTGLPFDYHQVGWNRSLYAWESFLPQLTAQPTSQSVQSGNSISFSVAANQTTDIAWYKVGDIPGI